MVYTEKENIILGCREDILSCSLFIFLSKKPYEFHIIWIKQIRFKGELLWAKIKAKTKIIKIRNII